MSSAGQFNFGNDGPAHPATAGYRLNHFALLVNDMEATKHFYGEILGMREMFTYHASSTYEIVYMAYSRGGEDGRGFQTGEELFSEKNNVDGLLELLALKNSPEILPTTRSLNTFSHIGLVVPDVHKVQARMEQYGVKILKPVGEDIAPDSEVGKVYGFAASLQEARAAAAAIASMGFANFLVVADPDGNVVEMQNRDMFSG